MSNKAFQQNLDGKKGPQPGGPYLIQMLFKEPVEMPDKEKMTAIMEKHIGSTECFCYDKKMAGFAALDHVAEFQDGKCPVQLMVMKCDRFKGKGFDAFLMSQMWDCQEDRDRIFRECKYQVVATDMLTAALSALERANLDADFLEALAELYPTCEAVSYTHLDVYKRQDEFRLVRTNFKEDFVFELPIEGSGAFSVAPSGNTFLFQGGYQQRDKFYFLTAHGDHLGKKQEAIPTCDGNKVAVEQCSLLRSRMLFLGKDGVLYGGIWGSDGQ